MNAGTDSELTTLFYMIIDIIIFLFAVFAVVHTSKLMTDTTYDSAKMARQNTTFTEQRGEPITYNSVYNTANGGFVYDGEVNGSDVIENIINEEESIDIYINGSSQYVSSAMRKDQIKTKDGKQRIANLINRTKKYEKKLVVDTDGKISKIYYDQMSESATL